MEHFERLAGITPDPLKRFRNVRALADLTGIDSQHLLGKHSCAPYTQAFTMKEPISGEQLASDEHFSENSQRGKYLLSRHPRFCPECVAEDLGWYKYSLWRRHHQILGADNCCKHGCPLVTAFVDPLMHLPGDCECSTQQELIRWPGHDTPLAKAFSEIALDLLDRPTPIPLDQIARALTVRANDRGLTSTWRKGQTKRTAGDLVSLRDRTEVRWAEALACNASLHSECATTFVNSAVSGGVNNTAAIILAALLVTDTKQEAANLVTSPSGRIEHMYQRIPADDLFAQYAAFAGRFEKIANAASVAESVIRKRALPLGLPACGHLSPLDIDALCLIDSGHDLDEAIAQAGASAARVTQFLAVAARPQLTKLIPIIRDSKRSSETKARGCR